MINLSILYIGAENIEQIQEANADYERLVSERVGSDKYTHRAMLTFHNNTKDKETLTTDIENFIFHSKSLGPGIIVIK